MVHEHFPPHQLCAEIHAPSFTRDLPEYMRHVTTLLWRRGKAETRGTAPSAVQIGDVIDETVMACLSGDRRWRKDQTFGEFFKDALKSTAYNDCRKDRQRRKLFEMDGEEPAAPSSRRVERMVQREELAEVRKVLDAHPRTKAWLQALEQGVEDRAAIAEALGWSPEEVSRVREIAGYRLAAAHLGRDGHPNKRTG